MPDIAVGPVVVDAGTAAKWTARIIGAGVISVVVLVALAMIFAGLAAKQGNDVEVNCGPAVSMPLGDQGLNVTGKIGDKMHKPNFSSAWQTVKSLFRAIEILRMWIGNIGNHAQGLPEGSGATGWRNRTEQDKAADLAACCPSEPIAPADPDEAPKDPAPPKEEWDPKNASLQLEDATSKEERQVKILRTAISVRKAKDLPPRADLVIAVAGLVESNIANLNYGDRDSLGWLQQRPSAGWGSPSQIRDIRYSSAKFFDHLKGVDGWQSMTVGRAAQKVQISAFPDRYDKRTAEAKKLLAMAGGGNPDTQDAPAVPKAPPSTPNIACESQSPTTGTIVPADTAPIPGGTTRTPASFNKQGNPRTVEQTMTFLENMIEDKTPIQPDMCARYVARAYGWKNSGCYPWSGDRSGCTAIGLWHSIPDNLKRPGKSNPPRGALVFWKTKNAARHIAISAGNGKIISTDIPNGRWGTIDLEEIDRWGPRIGWAAPHWPAHSGTQA